MNPKFFWLITVILLVFNPSSRGAAGNENPRIGFLSNNSLAAVSSWNEAFREGLRELGYVEGKNIVIEYRFGEGKLDRLPAMVAELVRLKVDVIVTGGPSATVLPKKQVLRFPLSWRRILILSAMDSSRALRGRAGTLPVYPRLPRNQRQTTGNSEGDRS
jgi:hypothetical protein